MRALLQRVSSGLVSIEGKTVGSIGKGLVVFLGIKCDDTPDDAKYLAEKCLNLRIFSDAADKFNLSALQCGAEVLVVSQFTLYGDCQKGRRPNFSQAGIPVESEPLYEYFISKIQKSGLRTESGIFGAKMLVQIQNDGPVTLMVESKNG